MLYFSDLLPEKHSETYGHLSKALQKHEVEFRLLKNTADIWCRDYMPVNDSFGRLVMFRYEPHYLQAFGALRTSQAKVLKTLPIHLHHKSDLNLDGGNIVRHGRNAIVTERIYLENRQLTKEEIWDELRSSLGIEKLIVLPCEPPEKDMTGHADGLCRFIDDATVLVNDLSYNPELRKKVLETLQNHRLEVVEIRLSKPFYDRFDWSAYINFLDYGNVIYLPVYGIEEDADVIDFFESCFRRHTIEPVPCIEIVLESGVDGGGALNCISWSDKDAD